MSVVLARSSGFLFIEFATVTQNDDRGWNRTFVPVDINPFITHPAHERLYHTTRVYAPYSLRTAVCGYFMSHKNQNSELKGCKMGRTVFRPYQKRLECVTISICHNKGSTFSSVILRPWQPRPQGSFPWFWRWGAPPTKPGKSALGTRLRTWVLVRLWLNPRPPAGGTPLYKPSAAPKGKVFAPFGLKTGIHFSHSGLELGMVFEGTTGVYERIRKSNIRIRSVF